MCFPAGDCFLHTSVIHCESCALRSGLEKKNESKRAYKKHIFRENRICPVGCGGIRRPWKHLALSISGCEIRRRDFPVGLHPSGDDVRLYDDRCGNIHWPHDGKSPVGAFKAFGNSGWLRFGGWINAIIPILIVPYYSVIGGWVVKYLVDYVLGRGSALAADGYFSAFISNGVSAEVCFAVFAALTLTIIFAGVENGIERVSKFMMPVLVVLSVIIAVYSVTRPGALEGVKYFLVPNLAHSRG